MATRGGQDGNNNATKSKVWSDALRKHIVQNPEELEKAAKAIFAKAKDGDVAAMKEIGDRLEGKVAQRIEGAGENGEHLFTGLTIEFVNSKNSTSE